LADIAQVHVTLTRGLHDPTARHGGMVSSPAAYSGEPNFDSQPGVWLS